VYDLESPLKAIEENIDRLSTTELGRLINGTIKVRHGDADGWRQTVLSYGRFYYDYGDTACVDIRLKQVENRTIAFIFMHTDDEWKNKTVADMLRSFDRGSSNRK